MKNSKIAILLGSVLMIQGCAAIVIAGAAGGAAAYTDRRTTGAQIDDQTIEVKAAAAIAKDPALSEHTNLNVISFNRTVLVVGQSPNSRLKDMAIKRIKEVEGVRSIKNQIRVGNLTSITTRSNDVWLTSKVKTQLLADENIPGNSVKVITENGEVFLMGLVSKAEANLAVEKARNISGVNRVFKAFEYTK